MTQSYRDCPERNVSQLPQYKSIVLLFYFRRICFLRNWRGLHWTMRISTQNRRGPLCTPGMPECGASRDRDENASDSILDKALQMISETSAVHTEENNRKVCVELSFCGISGFSRCGAREFSQMAEIRTARYFYGIFLKNSENWLLCGEICSKINQL